jgi:hypothetical protein
MEPEERAEALRSLKRMIDEEFFAMAVAESGDETARYMECPRCGSDHVVKRGLDGRGEQRFLGAAAREPLRRGPTACSRRRSSTARPG